MPVCTLPRGNNRQSHHKQVLHHNILECILKPTAPVHAFKHALPIGNMPPRLQASHDLIREHSRHELNDDGITTQWQLRLQLCAPQVLSPSKSKSVTSIREGNPSNKLMPLQQRPKSRKSLLLPKGSNSGNPCHSLTAPIYGNPCHSHKAPTFGNQ